MSLKRLSTGSGYQPTGALNTQVQLLERSAQRDPATGDFGADVVFATCWARVQALSRKYTDKPDKTTPEATHVVYIRWIPDVTSAMKIQIGNAIFLIEGAPVDPDGLQMELQLFCYQRNG